MTKLSDGQALSPLPFKVSPHMLEDLGLNLYSSLPRVLVEFIANAYDADATQAKVTVDFDNIKNQREVMRAQWKLELAHAKGKIDGLKPLEERLLPDNLTISIQDNGHGMTIEELKDKFLVAGRRRRLEEQIVMTPNGRALMGRKGVGKLAGFGVARKVEVVTKVSKNDHAHAIRLDFDEIMTFGDTKEITIPTFKLSDDANLGKQGTRITLSKLVHESTKSQEATVRTSIGGHFVLIDETDFSIYLNKTSAGPDSRTFAYAWPQPELGKTKMVKKEISEEEAGRPVEFSYRLRFVGDQAALMASERGIRVYAHKRLAAAPSLLNADTNMHGFRMTDYLDGVVHADFIDSLDQDYIATDRQGLRWETPLLQPVHQFLSEKIKEACKEYQNVRDKNKRREVEDDEFTMNLINRINLSHKERALAIAICVKLASFHKKGVCAGEYQEHARILVQAVGKGEVFTAISKIAEKDHPNLLDLAGEVTRLTSSEIDQTLSSVRTRLLAIDALEKIVRHTDFKEGNNEDDLHKLLKGNPWLIDPTFFEFLTSNQREHTLFARLERGLEIGRHAPQTYDKNTDQEIQPFEENKRPDLVFLLGNEGLGRVVIIELKAPNTPLLHKHLLQLEDYMRDTENFLKSEGEENKIVVEGRLIGTLDLRPRQREVQRLQSALHNRGADSKWAVFSLSQLLIRTRSAHKEFLDVHDGASIPAENGN